MKKMKKILAVLLTAAMLFMLPVSAMATDLGPRAYAYMSDDGSYCSLYLENFGLDTTLAYVNQYASEQSCEINDVIVRILIDRADGQDVFHITCNYVTGRYNIDVSGIDSEGTYCNWDEGADAPVGGGIYLSDEEHNACVLLDTGSEYITKIANADTVVFKVEITTSDGAVFKSENWTIVPFDNELGDFRTADDEPLVGDDTSSDTTGDDTVSDIPNDDETGNDDTASDIPTEDETGNDDAASDKTDEEANKDDTDSTGSTEGADDDNKTSAETGAEGVAVAAAIALTAVGAAVLSRRKR